ncbi:immunoglobulin lambda-1 light chain-like [Peromyscus californicus insignis]|uniref:immunoglobulin lambda-1 light chain-like n=1 Tax=Peromyscus californicus insignis TaxID=564181 RepID=UPI0022A78F2F|nr:immunoglobulin lambda-1 light chain-like [Peromyscus californicus insignis]
MAWTLLLFFLLQCTGSFSQPVLTQSPSASASLGASAKLTCTLSSQHISNYIEWFQQHPEKAPKHLMHLQSDGSHSKGDGIPDRFSGSSSGPDRYLSIDDIQPEDEAHYYCGANYSNGYWVFGGGTTLTVLGEAAVTPSVSLFSPPSEELKTKKPTLVCVMTVFYPGIVTVTWEADGTPITQGVDTTKSSKQIDSFLYMASSYLTLREEELKSISRVSCLVTHEGDTVEKSLSTTVCF